MAFSISGSTITQSGTDLNLSALGDVEGVTATTLGTGKELYNIGNRTLQIDGTLNHDPENEILIIGNGQITVRSGGTYNYGNIVIPTAPQITEGRTLPDPVGTSVTRGCGIIQDSTSPRNSSSSNGSHAFRVGPGGTLNWRGGEMQLNGTFFAVNATDATPIAAEVNIVNGRMIQRGGDVMRLENGAGININGLEKIGGFLYTRNGTPTRFDGYVPIHCNDAQTANPNRAPYALLVYGTSASGSSGLTDPTTFNDYAGIGNANDVALLDNGYSILQNPIDGINTTVLTWLPQTNNRSDGRCDIQKRINYTFTDLITGDPIEDAVVFYRDVNSGVRGDHNSRQEVSGENLENDRFYRAQTDEDGNASINVKTLIVTANSESSTNNGLVRDRRVSSDGSVEVYAVDYNYELSQPDTVTTGIGDAEVPFFLTPDPNVTASLVVANSYTNQFIISGSGTTRTISVAQGGGTLDQLYDRWKLWVTNVPLPSALSNIAVANVELGLNVVPTGTTLDVSDFTFLISAPLTAGDKFDTLTGTYGSSVSLSNINLDGTINLSGTISGANNLTNVGLLGNLNVVGGTSADWTNVTFGPAFSVSAGAGTGKTINLFGDVDVTETNTARAIGLLETAGFTVNTPPSTVTVPLDGHLVFISTDGTTINTVEEVDANEALNVPSGGPWNAYYKPTNTSTTVYSVSSLTNLTRATGVNTNIPFNTQAEVLTTRSDYPATITIASDTHSSSGVVTVNLNVSGTGSTLTAGQSKQLLLDITDRPNYVVASGIADINDANEPIQLSTGGTIVDTTYITLDQTGTQAQVSLQGVNLTNDSATTPFSNELDAASGVRTFITGAITDGISVAEVVSAVNQSNVGVQVNSMASDRLLGIRPGTHLT